ncbi:MAG: hypothetical protein O7D34_07285, partial [Ignavibacteria bacterium]|nr:hypothetical protein [Ignavibacteria bacterium]
KCPGGRTGVIRLAHNDVYISTHLAYIRTRPNLWLSIALSGFPLSWHDSGLGLATLPGDREAVERTYGSRLY